MTDQNVLTSDDLAKQALEESDQKDLPAGDDEMSLPAGTPSPALAGKVGETLSSLQNVIERNVSELDRLKEQLSTYRDSLKSIMDNDEELSDAQDAATAITQKVKERKAKLTGSPEVNQLKANITEVTERKKEIEEALNTHLLNIYQLTGVKTFDTADGETREFDIRASVKSGKKAA